MSNNNLSPRDRLVALFDGIFLGRTLHDLETQAGASIEELLKAVRDDEQAYLDFKANREWGAYIIESEITTKLRDNAENPEGANKTNALKLYADHMHWVMERANPGVFSGKADISSTVPVQIITTLDLGAVKRIEDVYELTATVTNEKPADEISDSEFKLLETSAREAPSSSPFDAAVATIRDSSSIEEAAERLSQAINVGRGEEVSERAGEAAQESQALEKASPRPKPRRQRRVVRAEQGVVERGTQETQS